MNVMDRVRRLHLLYRLRRYRKPAHFVYVPESALLELARAFELVEKHSNMVREAMSVFIPRQPRMDFGDDAEAVEKMRDMIVEGRMHLFGLQVRMGVCLAVGREP